MYTAECYSIKWLAWNLAWSMLNWIQSILVKKLFLTVNIFKSFHKMVFSNNIFPYSVNKDFSLMNVKLRNYCTISCITSFIFVWIDLDTIILDGNQSPSVNFYLGQVLKLYFNLYNRLNIFILKFQDFSRGTQIQIYLWQFRLLYTNLSEKLV